MGFTENYMLKLSNADVVTIFIGSGKFLDKRTNDVWDIYSIQLPFNANGKHITVHSKDTENPDTIENREYFDGKILSFQIDRIEYQ